MTTPSKLPTSKRISHLRTMLMIREFELRVGDLFADGELPGFVHLYLGQEAVATGACGALHEDDYITSTHRGHGHCLAKGMNPKRMMAELYGRAEGYCQGKGGSMHIADISKGMLGANGIIGSGQPLAVGAGMKASVHDSDEVVISFLGDGGVAQGQVHESINLAAVWDLPVIFFIENNQYAEASSVTSQYSITDLSDIAGSYNLPGETIDGMDVEEVSRTTSRAVERARNGDGPSVLEANTYRYHGHFEGDPETYRQQSEVEEWQNRDPIIRFTEQLLDEGNLTKSELEEMRKEIEKEIDAAVKFGRQSTKPPVEKAYHGMYDEAPADIEYHRDRPKKGTR